MKRMVCRRHAWIVLLLILVLAIGCGDSSNDPSEGDASWESHRSDLERDLSPRAAPGEIEELAEGCNAFGFDLYERLRGMDGNLLISPLSIHIAFAMVYGGARGETAAEMAEVLRFTLEQEDLHDAYNALDLELEKRNHAGDAETDPVELYPANAFWGKMGRTFVESYLDLLALQYGAGLETLDFGNQPEESRQVINGWVEEETRERIEDLIPPGAIVPTTVAVLTNALYFKAPWEKPFDEEVTFTGGFRLPRGGEVGVPMMSQAAVFLYAEGDGYQALEMGYRERELAMLFLLPRLGEFDRIEASLTGEWVEGVVSEMESLEVSLTLPRFKFGSSSISLKDTLMAMGLVQPFGGAADFTGIIEDGGIAISDAFHKTFIAVDEKGTEAAAATAVILVESAPAPVKEFVADRPFLFLIRDRATGVNLFVGRVVDPR